MCIIQLVVCLIPVQEVHQCYDEVERVTEFCSTDLKKCLQRYAQDVENPNFEGMVEAMFECFEALLNYKGKSSRNPCTHLLTCLCHIHTCTCSSGQGSTESKHGTIDKDCHTRAL